MTDEANDSPAADPDPRLEAVDDRIEEAKRLAREDGVIDDPDERKWYESGTIHPELDDQTIAPPG
ncbi:MAG: hypothetical protein AB7H43_09480 [Acidimicrobiia bacterium]